MVDIVSGQEPRQGWRSLNEMILYVTRLHPVIFYTLLFFAGLPRASDESYLAKGKCALRNCSRTRFSQPSGRVSTSRCASPTFPLLLHNVPRALLASLQLHL